MMPDRSALIDDPAWVRERYQEAKELIADVRQEVLLLDPDIRERVDDFYTATFLDTCTTLGPDCGCNPKGSR